MTVEIRRKEIGNLLLENIPDIPVLLKDRLQLYQQTREAALADWLPDGSGLLISTRFGEAAQIHEVVRPGHFRKQLTFFDEPVYIARTCPDADRQGFLFARDTGGNEAFQLYFYDLRKQEYQMLTDGESKHSSGVWNREGSAFIYSSTKRNGIDQDLYLYDLAGGTGERLAFTGKGYWYPVAWAPGGQYVTVINYRSINESHLHILDVETGQLQTIQADPNIACRSGIWSADGRRIYYTSDAGSEWRWLMAYDLESGATQGITRGLGWEVEGLQLSADGTQLAFVINKNGISELYLYHTAQDEYSKVEVLPTGVITDMRWHPKTLRLALTINTPQAPADAYVLDVETMDLQQWTFSEVGGLDRKGFVKPQLIHYPTFDQVAGKDREIPAFYYRPEAKDEPVPVLIYIHGGPESQFRPGFSPAFQYYLKELGVAVLAPNVRGSSGYGKHYLKLDNGFKREDSVRDIGALLDWVEQQPELDSRRVAVMGGSYGGYMVLASMSHYNDRLCCGIDIVGISNFITFLKNTKSYRRDLRRVEYGDERDPAMRRHLEQISPTTNAHKITKPMLIVQGQNDPRVPASEAEQMLRAIRKNGGEAWYLLAKDEGHGFRKKSNRDFYNQAVILFLQTYLMQPLEVAVPEALVTT
ncbi:MAG: prolyl oligopeptidase family serine peptidase [Phaeodactylibacter sp.]|uniref:S9 family peptidase n=1 Tax=Phaeodactylibacter sp. TaxID=1940289 RepID=UPI0032EF8827